MRDQRIRDPIYNLIKFDGDSKDDQLLWRLIQSEPMQRLRRIRQLGLSESVFPGAVHTRFSHSIGTMEMARRLMAILDASDYVKTHQAQHGIQKTATQCAALLHDVGHGPFSHIFEDASKKCGIVRDHEAWTADIIDQLPISDILRDYSEELPALVNAFFSSEPGSNPYTVIVSSSMDADRLDFLQRDRHFSGFGMGSIDIAWLIDCLKIQEVEDEIYPFQFVVSRKGIRVIEEYLTSYAAMYEGLYFHKTTRAAQMMLSQFLEELFAKGIGNDLLDEKEPIQVYFRGPTTLANKSEFWDVENYLRLDDFTVWNLVQKCSTLDLGRASELAVRILNRDFFKCFEIPQDINNAPPAKINQFRREMERVGLEFMTDKIRSKGFKQYDPEEIDSLKDIFIEPIEGNFAVPFSTCSKTAELLKTSPRNRFYFDSNEERQKCRDIWKSLSG